MPLATAASKRRLAPDVRASDSSSGPRAASNALLAVTTDLPARSARSTSSPAGDRPPRSSTTTSRSARSTTAARSAVRSTSAGSSTCRWRPGSRTPTATSSGPGAPWPSAVRRHSPSTSRAATALPTVPRPSRPTRSGRPAPDATLTRLIVPAAQLAGRGSGGGWRLSRCTSLPLLTLLAPAVGRQAARLDDVEHQDEQQHGHATQRVSQGVAQRQHVGAR